jgi:hypothetical protein
MEDGYQAAHDIGIGPWELFASKGIRSKNGHYFALRELVKGVKSFS